MLRLRTFGSVGLEGPDGQDLGSVLAQPKRLALLIFLAAARPAGVHRRDDLLARFWPDLDEGRARDALNQALRFLRQALGADAVVSRGADEVGVDPGRVWCDAVAFRQAAAGGRPGEALELYRGEFLRGFFVEEGGGFEDWVEGERAEYREAAARGARELAEREAETGAFTQAVAWGRRALELTPDDERALRRLLRWYDRAGDRAGAFRAYEAFAKRFAEEFGSPLSEETKDLVERLRLGKPLDDDSRPAPKPESAPQSSPVPRTEARAGPVALTPPQAGETLGDRYRIERKIGAGGMAVVYLAQDLKHDREVALKVLRPEIAEGLARERFIREIRIAGRLQHPNIVPLFDSGEADGRLFYVMPHVQGETLRERLKREGRLPVEEVVHLLREIAGALAYAHEQGVIHRDIKPENVLLIDRRAVLTDFGIARAAHAARTPGEGFDATLTQPGASLGTPAYMAPEQALGSVEIDHRADLYALGAVAYEMLAGRTPFTGATAQELLAAQLTATAPPVGVLRPEVLAGLAAVVMQCLEKRPEGRPETAAVLLGALASLESVRGSLPEVGSPGDQPIARAEPGPEARTGSSGAPPLARRARALVLGLAALGLLGLGIERMIRADPGLRGTPSETPEALSRIAVLYFEDASSDGRLRWLARGLTEDLIDALASVAGLTVPSRGAVRAYEGKAVTPQAIGRALNVGLLIDGTVQPWRDSTDAVTLVVRLVDARTGVQLERETLTRSGRERAVLRRDLASLVEVSLRRRIGVHVQLRADRQAAGSDSAWELLRRARELRSEALQLEPGLALERLRLADSLLAGAERDGNWVEPIIDRAALALVRVVAVPASPAAFADSAERVLLEGIDHANRALRRAPRNPRALSVRGELGLRLVQLARPGRSDTVLRAAREDLLQASALDPGLARAWYALTDVELLLGHDDESYLAARKALAADIYASQAAGVLNNLFLQALTKSNRPAADTLCAMGQLNFPADPNFQTCEFTVRTWLGSDGRAVTEAERLLRGLDSIPQLRTARAYRQLQYAALLARAGLRDSASAMERRVLSEVRGGDARDNMSFHVANVELLLGNRERAIQILAKYSGVDSTRRATVRNHAWFASLRGDPAFDRATAKRH